MVFKFSLCIVSFSLTVLSTILSLWKVWYLLCLFSDAFRTSCLISAVIICFVTKLCKSVGQLAESGDSLLDELHHILSMTLLLASDWRGWLMMVPCLRSTIIYTSEFSVQIFHCHHFMIDKIPLSNVLLLLGVSNDAITALWWKIDGLLKLLITHQLLRSAQACP